METNDPSPSNDAMREGMEEPIAALAEPGQPLRLLEDGDATESTLPPSDGGGDRLAGAPWQAVESISSAHDGRPRVLERGATVGRFVALDKLGAGGMGVVYSAYDPELDRKIALKLLLPGAVGSNARTRLLREAQALAKLSHPNVVAVHDVGTVDEQVWLAMEFVQGHTLSAWLKQPRGWRDVVKAMRAAGQGLAAAHAANLLHRDFKPDNVMVGDDGRVRVMDFGLARTQPKVTEDEAKETQADAEAEAEPNLGDLAVRITKAGTLVGTPAYMAPEQLGLEELSAATDQFAFCVTLWEALYGERPFRGRTAMEIAAHVLGGRRSSPPKGKGVPSWLRRACERGLAVKPEQRWPSMQALLETLAKGRARARIRKGLVAIGVLAGLGAGAEGYRRFEIAARTTACEATGDEIEDAWSDERRQALRDGLVATGVSSAETTAQKVMPWLDRQAAGWREARVEACLDADIRGTWSAETLDRSLWCLEERHTELQSLVDELTLTDPEVLQKAVVAVAGLGSPSPCRDERVLETMEPPPLDRREAIRAVRADVTRAGNLELAGRYQSGLDLARSALVRADALEWKPLSAAARLRVALMLNRTGAYADAEVMLEDAFFEAGEGVAPDVAFAAAAALVLTVGDRLARYDDGRRWARHADAALADIRGDTTLQRARLDFNIAEIDSATGEYDRAEELHEHALAIFEATLGPEHPVVGSSVTHLAIVHYNRASFDRAKALYERALAIRTSALGPDHPSVGASLVNLAMVHADMGSYAEAKALHERALAIMERALGPEHPSVAASLTNLAIVHNKTGSFDEARRLNKRALAIREKRLGPDHPDVALGLVNLADDLAGLGRYEEAKAHYLRASTIFEQKLGPDHLKVGMSLAGLAAIQEKLGALDEAKASHLAALSIYEKILPADHPYVNQSQRGLAEIAYAQGRPEEAVALARRAMAGWEHGSDTTGDRALTRIVLARALWDAATDGDGDRVQAMSLAEQARDELRDTGVGGPRLLTELEQWITEHRGPG